MDTLPSPLDPRHLETFRRVAQTGTVTEAARRLALSQPAVTAQIRTLEQALGCPLFLRSRTGMVLTEAGQRLLDIAQRLHNLLAEAADLGAAPLRLGPLELGASTTAAANLIPPLLEAFLRRDPQVAVHVSVGNTAEMLTAVREGRLALALVEGLPRASGLRLEPYTTDELVLVAAASLPGPIPNRVADLRPLRLLWREEGSGTRAVVARALGRGRPFQPGDLVIGHTEALKHAVMRGLGLGFLSRLSITHDVEAGRLKILPLEDLHIPRTYSWVMGSGALSPSAAAFLRCVTP